jgi:hypothetical protein
MESKKDSLTFAVEGVANTPAVVLLRSEKSPRVVTLDGKSLAEFKYSADEKLLWIQFSNESRPRELKVEF